MRLSTTILLMFLPLFLVADTRAEWPPSPPLPYDCSGVLMHLDYGHHLIIEPKCWII